jgi:hypothetical protein
MKKYLISLAASGVLLAAAVLPASALAFYQTSGNYGATVYAPQMTQASYYGGQQPSYYYPQQSYQYQQPVQYYQQPSHSYYQPMYYQPQSYYANASYTASGYYINYSYPNVYNTYSW